MNKDIKYKIKKSSRAKRLRLAVYCDGSVVATVPRGVKQSTIKRYIADKEQWLLDKINFFKSIDNKAISNFSEADYMRHKEEALKFVEKRVKSLSKKHGFSYNKVMVKNHKTRWGSCSKSGNLNFNYKIIFLPKRQQDYIIIHELCHLKELNHSRKFWLLVEEIMPNYLKIKNELKNQGLFYR
ncbi:MAG TPA: M48 family metallopeptidase [Candidatus Moranbacteria bacterium]|nr:M48 family metallopeptidase [Candidatus Moranbacteria bacterium]